MNKLKLQTLEERRKRGQVKLQPPSLNSEYLYIPASDIGFPKTKLQDIANIMNNLKLQTSEEEEEGTG